VTNFFQWFSSSSRQHLNAKLALSEVFENLFVPATDHHHLDFAVQTLTLGTLHMAHATTGVIRALFDKHQHVKNFCGRATTEEILQLSTALLRHTLKI
jgi:hypothetical protein